MKIDLKLLSMRISQAKDEPAVPTGGVNPYLLSKILLPSMNGGTVYLRDIDYDAFDTEDIEPLEKYYSDLSRESGKLRQFTETVQKLPPEARKARMFC